MTLPASLRPSVRALDSLEKGVLCLLFGWLTYRIFQGLADNPLNLIYLTSEGAVVAFVLARRATDNISVNPLDWLVGACGTFLPLLLIPTTAGHMFGAVPLLAGVLISIGAKFSLRRSFGIVAANRGIKRTGLYAAVRHPMYLGYFIAYSGALILNPSWFNAGLLSLWACFQLARIHAEERILLRDPLYQAHAKLVRYRLLPLVY